VVCTVVEQADVVVIGMGPGGQDAAERLAEAGLDVVGVDQRLVGGECPYWGCVPSKMMIRAANLIAETRRANGIAGPASIRPDWSLVAGRIRAEATDDWDDRVAVERFTGKGGRFVRGHGRVLGPGRVGVGDQEFQARRAIILNTGTRPAVPPIDGLAGTPYWTNHEALETDTLPTSLAVLGGGAIGVELAQVFARFGARVSVLEAGARPLAVEEPESSEAVAKALTADGVDVRVGARVVAVRYDGEFSLDLSDGDQVRADRLLVAVGRRTDLDETGLGTVGVDESARFVPVDDALRAAPDVYVIGDVTGKGAFTHISMYQADIVVRTLLGEQPPPADYRALPRVTFTDPEVGAAGLTEAQARANGLRVRTGFAPLPASSRGWIHKAGNDGFVKLVADADRGVLVGGTTAGPAGGEMLGLVELAVRAQVPISLLRQMITAYPTFYRTFLAALADLG
jgi:pyruvate/2-oxoglutarate dehydrogenase complex dihydrolipoamide dehydrogenase (E3) component